MQHPPFLRTDYQAPNSCRMLELTAAGGNLVAFNVNCILGLVESQERLVELPRHDSPHYDEESCRPRRHRRREREVAAVDIVLTSGIIFSNHSYQELIQVLWPHPIDNTDDE